MAQHRQLAVIMFTDIVGYTALMGNDEQKAFEILNKNRNIQKPYIEQYQGRWIKEIGDGVLASFNTVTDAVNAAIKIQEGCSKEKEFLLRIGIHLGEVIFEMDDVFGDAVNIAARIQAMAAPGGIFISESIYNNISNKQDIKSRFVKQEILKNVKDPVRVYEIIHIAESDKLHEPIKEQSSKAPAKSIAVLPFTNMSNDPDQEYFSDGMAEEIINSLAHIKDLKIAGRTSSAQFKGKNLDLREIGKILGVSVVLEGSVRKQGNRIRITAQLINVEDGFHLFSVKYDRNMDDIFAIQDELALAITDQLKITLLGEELEAIIKVTTNNTEAYDLVLKGRFHLNRRGSSIITGLQYFKQ
ncbi:MAG: adenylate/guanylate cyclase domain-containing protein, partial [Saprospiraceae bacterium]